VADVLLYGDTFRSPELRHEVPIGIPDPFLYAERDGKRLLLISMLEQPRVDALGTLESHGWTEFGHDELIEQGLSRPRIEEELVARAVRGFGIERAAVPRTFPVWLADRLRADGLELTVDQELFDDRRRVKNAAELAGIRRAQRAAEAGMTAARDLLRRAAEAPDGLQVDGQPLTSELLKVAISRAFVEHGTTAEEFIVSHGPQAAIGHHMGEGRILAGEPIVIDLWPRDNESACFADMTRTFVVGEIPAELVEWHALVNEALDRSLAEIREGAAGGDVYAVSCDVFEAAGQATARTKEPGKPLDHGFFHGLGHGVGLEVHEEPGLGRVAQGTLRAGDVVTVEPGLYRPQFGGLRLEDLVLVTPLGSENLTDFPYDLAP
jgi:Xaa-Pro aminopeptidase